MIDNGPLRKNNDCLHDWVTVNENNYSWKSFVDWYNKKSATDYLEILTDAFLVVHDTKTKTEITYYYLDSHYEAFISADYLDQKVCLNCEEIWNGYEQLENKIMKDVYKKREEIARLIKRKERAKEIWRRKCGDDC